MRWRLRTLLDPHCQDLPGLVQLLILYWLEFVKHSVDKA